MMATATLAGPLQALIDFRLDTIDRVLLGRVPREDRLAIVREVESQIHELLAGRDPDTLGREDVLAVLGRLDPPEAYLPDEAGEPRPAPVRRIAAPSAFPTPTARSPARFGEGNLGGILGLSALGLVLLTPVFYVIAALSESEILVFVALFGIAILGVAGGISGLVLSIRGRHQGAWPILGIVAGAIALTLSLLGAFFVLLELLAS
jgi:hypothetical protein